MNQEEKKFNSWLRTKLSGDYMRVESTTMQGVPDINICDEGREIWIESKIYRQRHSSPLLEPEQHAWGYRRSFYGGRVWVVALEQETDMIHCYKHPLIIRPCLGRYVRIVAGRTQHQFPRSEPERLKSLFLL